MGEARRRPSVERGGGWAKAGLPGWRGGGGWAKASGLPGWRGGGGMGKGLGAPRVERGGDGQKPRMIRRQATRALAYRPRERGAGDRFGVRERGRLATAL